MMMDDTNRQLQRELAGLAKDCILGTITSDKKPFTSQHQHKLMYRYGTLLVGYTVFDNSVEARGFGEQDKVDGGTRNWKECNKACNE